ncbi:C4-dicarboxylate transporter/malic acid transport protein-like protein [Tothia fuscella]|uniref:Sulfite efflux pump SSU1 n=1 Tax=Tothia fuscella TaxID=1048955 RepID=A0A9P4U4E6_9PEZI|nr:C4-dicarboxylate transporter/malic acid transport protein-like protein [Tothia fuscella]
MENLAENNPAVAEPASAQLPPSGGLQNGSTDNSNGNIQNGTHKKPEKFEAIPPTLTKYDVGWRRVVRNFSPSWFSVTMGTGIVSILLNFIPFHSHWLYILSIIFFILNTILFTLAFLTSLARYTLYPEIWSVMIRDPANSLFLGTIPMGFATLIEMWIFVCVPIWGDWAKTVAWALWMVDTVAAVWVTVSLSFLLMSQDHISSLDRITSAQLLPIAATIVAAGTGAEVAEILPNPHHAFGTVITCYILWGMSVPLAMIVLAIYYQRLAVHKLPPREIIVSCFLPLGPLGFGGYTIMYLGMVSRHLFPRTEIAMLGDPMAGSIVYILGFFIALIMWGFGLLWLCIALASIHQSRPFPFNMGWWGFTFPLGVFSASTIQIGLEMNSMFFKVLGTIFSTCVILLWVVVAAGTARGAWNGKLFFAPCLRNLKQKEDGSVEDSNVSKAA